MKPEPLTTERVKALEEIIPEVDSSEESIAVIEDLIEFWKSKQPKPKCKYCGRTQRRHVSGHCRSNDEFKEILITRFKPVKL